LNKHFADDFVYFLMQVDPSKLTDDDPSFLEVGGDDELISELPESLKRLEAVRRRFRNLFTKAKRKLHSFLGLHYGHVARPEVMRGFYERLEEAENAREDFAAINTMFFHALTRFATPKLKGKQGMIYIRKGWKVVLAPAEDQKPLLVPESERKESPLEPMLTRDIAPLPEGMEPPPHEGQDTADTPPDPENEDGVSKGEE
jgi:hypothetical protein